MIQEKYIKEKKVYNFFQQKKFLKEKKNVVMIGFKLKKQTKKKPQYFTTDSTWDELVGTAWAAAAATSDGIKPWRITAYFPSSFHCCMS